MKFLQAVVGFTCFATFVDSQLDYIVLDNSTTGHVRNNNGSITWAQLPNATYKVNLERSSHGWGSIIGFAKSIVDGIQLHPFPYDLVRRISVGNYTYDEIHEYNSGVITACCFGGVYIAAMLICLVIYVVHLRNKGNKRKEKLDQYRDVKLVICVVAGYVSTFILFLFLLCTFVVNHVVHSGVSNIQSAFHNSVNDVETYFKLNERQYEYITSDTSSWLYDVTSTDLNDVGRLIWHSGYENTKSTVNPALSTLYNLDPVIVDVAEKLNILHTVVGVVRDGKGDLMKKTFYDVHYNLTNARNDWSCFGCEGNCTGCSNIDPDQITVGADYAKLPNTTSYVYGMGIVRQQTIDTGPGLKIRQLYDIGVAEYLQGKYANATAELNTIIMNFTQTAGVAADNIRNKTMMPFNYQEMRDFFDAFYDNLYTGHITRYVFCWLASFVLLAIVVLYFVGISFYIKEKRDSIVNGSPIDTSISGKILNAAIISSLAVSSVYMSAAIYTFYVGANLENAVCQPMENLSFVDQFMDQDGFVPGYEGSFMGDAIHLNGTNVKINLGDVLRACDSNVASYELLLLQLLNPDIETDIDYKTVYPNVSDAFEPMYINLTDIELMSAEVQQYLADFVAAAAINFTEFDGVLYLNTSGFDVGSFVANIQAVYDTPKTSGGPEFPSKPRLLEVIIDLQDLMAREIPNLSAEQADVVQKYNTYKSREINAEALVTIALQELQTVHDYLHTVSQAEIQQAVDMYKARLIKNLEDYRNQTIHWMYNEVGACKPLRDAYDALDLHFCDEMSDPMNGLWVLLGFCLLFLNISTVVSIQIIRLQIDSQSRLPLIDITPHIAITKKQTKYRNSDATLSSRAVESPAAPTPVPRMPEFSPSPPTAGGWSKVAPVW